MKSVRQASVFVLVALSCAGACTLVSGVNDFQFGTAGAGANAGTSSNTGTGTTGSSPTGGAGGCTDGSQKSCGAMCVALDDPAFGCDLASCDACDPGSSCCPSCTNTTADPKRCGACTNVCNDGEWCTASQCECRPGLTLFRGSCVDPNTNPDACGGGAPCGGGTPLCEDGSCVATCSTGKLNCSGACVDTQTDELHCGECDGGCSSSQFCLGHDCISFVAAPTCTTCPCPTCTGQFSRCCNYPGSATAIVCVNQDAQGCP